MPPVLGAESAFARGKSLPSPFSLVLWNNATSGPDSQPADMDRSGRTGELASTPMALNLADIGIRWGGVKNIDSWGTWVAQSLSIQLLILAQVMILGSWDGALHWVPPSGRSLLEDSLSFSPSAGVCTVHMRACPLSQIIK